MPDYQPDHAGVLALAIVKAAGRTGRGTQPIAEVVADLAATLRWTILPPAPVEAAPEPPTAPTDEPSDVFTEGYSHARYGTGAPDLNDYTAGDTAEWCRGFLAGIEANAAEIPYGLGGEHRSMGGAI